MNLKKKIIVEDMVWIFLIGLTLASFEFVDGMHGWQYVSALVILIAMFKIRLVVMHFMEIKNAPLPLRLILEAWVAIVGGGVLAFQVL